MLIVDAVLAGSVEVELSQGVLGAVGSQGTVGQDNLEARAQVLELGIVRGRDVEVDAVGLSVVNLVGDDVDGRLELALGTGAVGAVQTVPVQRATLVGVVVGVDVHGTVSGTGHQRGAVKARGRDGRDEGEDSGELHCE